MRRVVVFRMRSCIKRTFSLSTQTAVTWTSSHSLWRMMLYLKTLFPIFLLGGQANSFQVFLLLKEIIDQFCGSGRKLTNSLLLLLVFY